MPALCHHPQILKEVASAVVVPMVHLPARRYGSIAAIQNQLQVVLQLSMETWGGNCRHKPKLAIPLVLLALLLRAVVGENAW